MRAAVESLPRELAHVADEVTIVLPWGSLLAAVARPDVPVLGSVRTLCQPGARLTVVVGVDPARDAGELARLGIDSLDREALGARVPEGYDAAGFRVRTVSALTPAELSRWPSSWAARLARGQGRTFARIEAEAVSRSG